MQLVMMDPIDGILVFIGYGEVTELVKQRCYWVASAFKRDSVFLMLGEVVTPIVYGQVYYNIYAICKGLRFRSKRRYMVTVGEEIFVDYGMVRFARGIPKLLKNLDPAVTIG